MTAPTYRGSPITVAVAGATGRMGRMLIEALIGTPDLVLHGALEAPGHHALGRDAGDFLGQRTGVTITDSIPTALTGAQVLIDFTRPAATLEHLAVAARTGTRLVIGTTGFSAAERAAVGAAATALPIVLAPNMGVGVNAMLRIVEVAAGILAEGYDVEIIEAHHRHKVDAPSGTALWLGEAVARASGRDLERDAVFTRHGETGPRKTGTIGFATIRGGDIVGEHTVLFAGAGEQITITHRSTSRASYAEGALRASRFLAAQAPGLYDMQDVLGLR